MDWAFTLWESVLTFGGFFDWLFFAVRSAHNAMGRTTLKSFALPFARSLAPLTHSLASHCSLCSRARAPLRSLAPKLVEYFCLFLSQFRDSLWRGSPSFSHSVSASRGSRPFAQSSPLSPRLFHGGMNAVGYFGACKGNLLDNACPKKIDALK